MIRMQMNAVRVFLLCTNVDEIFCRDSGNCWNSSAITRTEAAVRTTVTIASNQMTSGDLKKLVVYLQNHKYDKYLQSSDKL